VFSRHHEIREVVVRLSGREARLARYGIPRADVAEAHEGEPSAYRSGFETYVDVSELPRGPLRVEVLARFDGAAEAAVASRRIVLVRAGHAPGSRARRPGVSIRAVAGLAVGAIREGRLARSAAAWALSHMRLRRAPVPAAALQASGRDAADDWLRLDGVMLRHFLASGSRIRFAPGADPQVTVVLVLFNRAALTLRCLRSLAAERSVSLQVVIVDNASSDETVELLGRVEGAVVVRSRSNEGFLAGANRGAARASAPCVLFLNNDTDVLPGSIEAALSALRSSETIGAVGGRLVAMPGGRLQEAGSIVFGDGSCSGYGRDDDPGAPMYMFRRDVDFCSGAFLLTTRKLFEEVGGFDARFSPAYYEDVDFCARVWDSGRRVVYEPRAVVLHAEFGSAASRASAIEMQAARRVTFLEKHGAWIGRRPQRSAGAELLLRDRHVYARRVLYFDDRVPHSRLGAGFGRSAAVVRTLAELGCFVTLYPLAVTQHEWPGAYEEIPRTGEVMTGWGVDRLPRFMRDRAGYYDRVIVSRPPNMRVLQEVLGPTAAWRGSAPLIYDAEAVWAVREIGHRRVSGETLDEKESSDLIDAELQLAAGADAVFCASADEQRRFQAAGHSRALQLGHAVRPDPSRTPFERRDVVLFVGSFTGDSPNVDAARWFIREVLPRLRERVGDSLAFLVAGVGSDSLDQWEDPGVRLLGPVDDLRPLYERARLFVAPTRFAAGVPLKVIEAASQGVPVVCTSLLANQLQWHDEDQVLVADDPAAFALACERVWTDHEIWERLRSAALDRVSQEYSPAKFRETLREGIAIAGE